MLSLFFVEVLDNPISFFCLSLFYRNLKKKFNKLICWLSYLIKMKLLFTLIIGRYRIVVSTTACGAVNGVSITPTCKFFINFTTNLTNQISLIKLKI